MIEEGHSGVALFIVLSGFILSLGTIGREIHYGRFLVARILRIYPLFVVFLVFGMHTIPSDIQSFLTTLLPLNLPGAIGGGTFTAMFWAVAVEFQCYLIFPFLIAFSKNKGSRYLMQIIAIFIIFRMIAVLAQGVNARDLTYWTVVGRMDQFIVGMIAARLYVLGGWQNLNPLWFGVAVISVITALTMFNWSGGWPSTSAWNLFWPPVEAAIWAFFILTYISASRIFPKIPSMILEKIGEISYSVYLLHFVVIQVVISQQIWITWTGNGYYDAILTGVIIVSPISLAISFLTYHAIEKPFLNLRPRYASVAS